jgi:hypothetical protein
MRKYFLTFALALTSLVTAAACSSSDSGTATGDGAFTKKNPNTPTPTDIEVDADGFPKSTSVNDYSFSGCEYWPYKVEGSPYPDHIQWGCTSGSDAAKKCMAQAMVDLAKILQDPPAELKAFSQKNGISSFYNWNNDMTDAPADRGDRKPYLWIYNKSLIKWMSTTTRDGTCIVPTRDDLVKLMTDCMDNLNCRVYDESGDTP